MRKREQRSGRDAFVQRTDVFLEMSADSSEDGAMVVQAEVDGDPVPDTAEPSGLAPSASTPHAISERADIARRVIAFRDRQRLIRQQREDFCNAVQAETRAALRDGLEIPRN